MRFKQIPIIVSTLEGLNNALIGECSVIYIDESLYLYSQGQLDTIMGAHGYVPAKTMGKHGVFFLKSTGHNAFDPSVQEIYDPMGIL